MNDAVTIDVQRRPEPEPGKSGDPAPGRAPDDAPETPPDEPAPEPVKDPPAIPGPRGPYVVDARQAPATTEEPGSAL